ncbi:hypothetical protein BT93_A0920 [Corymbia citriodora subsp. variegata]|nr:hypothetical protein BT93_A0920 [Corymbia citriodora subsp. variegata]
MLDLNLGFVPADSPSGSIGTPNRPAHSPRSFASSILNVDAAAADDDVFVFAYDFGLVDRIGGSRGAGDGGDDGDGDGTIQLFPAAAAADDNGGGCFSGSQSRRPLLDLTCLEGARARETPWPPQQQRPSVKRSRRGPRSRSSQYRGVTFYRRTSRWESHIWDCGKQVYLGGFDTAHAAARAYDRAAIKFRGLDADINFNISDYEEDIKQMSNFTKEEFVHILRRQSTGFARGSSKYRGVTLHKCGRWEARMGQFLGKKAYDKAAIKCNGTEAVTNFERSKYQEEEEMDGNHSLDLNLGIAPPEKLDSTGGPRFPLQWNDMHVTQYLGLRTPIQPYRGLKSSTTLLLYPSISPT